MQPEIDDLQDEEREKCDDTVHNPAGWMERIDLRERERGGGRGRGRERERERVCVSV